ncbi:MAG: Lrp/AsnC family transcriptional regulator [Candidatus Thorarchaeota archaeon]|nr:Lrp/AsnC family transcriptional regulator [Candidatus Thorarchaeota archaeon]
MKKHWPEMHKRSIDEIKALLDQMDNLDELDIKIITLLQFDGRASFNKIADVLGTTVATISKRVKKLEQRGIIQGYAAIVACDKLGFRENLWLMIHTKPGTDAEEIGKQLSDMIGVKCVYVIYSDFDLLVHISCATTDEINRTVQSIGQIKDVVRVTKMTVSTKVKEDFRAIL